MRSPTPPPTNRDKADQKAEAFEVALSQRDFVRAAELFAEGLYSQTLAIICSEYQIRWDPEQIDGHARIQSLLAALEASFEKSTPSLKAVQARDTLEALGHIFALTEGLDSESEDSDVFTAKLFISATRLGYSAALAGLADTGLWSDFAHAKHKLFRMGEAQRGRQPSWEVEFANRATAYCAGKQKVTLGQLTRLARTWADDEVKAGRNPQLPSTDDGIKTGLKRMEAAGSLSIPGRNKGEP